MKIEYYSQYGGIFGSANFLGEDQLLVADAATLNDVWINRQLAGVAPAGAVEARLVLQFIQPNNQSGAVHIDDVEFRIDDVISLAGDYNRDGVSRRGRLSSLEEQFRLDGSIGGRRKRRRNGQRRRLLDLERQLRARRRVADGPFIERARVRRLTAGDRGIFRLSQLACPRAYYRPARPVVESDSGNSSYSGRRR